MVEFITLQVKLLQFYAEVVIKYYMMICEAFWWNEK